MAVMIGIFVYSTICFGLFSISTFVDGFYKDMGVGIFLSRGSAFAVANLLGITMFLVAYDITTHLRPTWFGRKFHVLFDHQVTFHRMCGYLMCFYGCVHVLGHMFGSIWFLSAETNLEKRNAMIRIKKFTTVETYTELLFFSLPGASGWILLIILLILGVTASERCRDKRFQCFAKMHLICAPIFFITLFIHGMDFWFNWGFPLSIFATVPSTIIITIQLTRRYNCTVKYKFKIVDISLTSNKLVGLLYMKRP
jgi:hypothetical protein